MVEVGEGRKKENLLEVEQKENKWVFKKTMVLFQTKPTFCCDHNHLSVALPTCRLHNISSMAKGWAPIINEADPRALAG